MKNVRHVFAVVRIDQFLTDVSPPENTITVKEIVLTQEEAEEEVQRLNKLNCDKNCLYFWQKTRFVDRQDMPASASP